MVMICMITFVILNISGKSLPNITIKVLSQPNADNPKLFGNKSYHPLHLHRIWFPPMAELKGKSGVNPALSP